MNVKDKLKLEESRVTHNLYKVYQLHDEPKMFQYSAKVKIDDTDGLNQKTIRASGATFESDDLAYIKCVGEAVERKACMEYKKQHLIWGSFTELQPHCIDISQIPSVEGHENYGVTKQTKISWIWGNDLFTGEQKLIPASLVFFNYALRKNEKYFYVPISTGAAGGVNLENAIYRGVLEVVERDAFTLAYMAKTKLPRVKLEIIPEINKIHDTLSRYRLKIEAIDLTNDLNVPCYASILTDNRGGPGVLVGLNADLNQLSALIGSMEEVVRARTWIRLEHHKHPKTPKNINTPEERGLYWYDPSMVKHLDFWLKSPRTSKIKKKKSTNNLNKLKELLTNINIYWVDLSQTRNYKVVKVIAPTLNPHSLIESLIPTSGERLRRVLAGRSINPIPNPFI